MESFYTKNGLKDPNDIKNTEGYSELSRQIVEISRSHFLTECTQNDKQSGCNIIDMANDMEKGVINIQSHERSLFKLYEYMKSFYTKNGLKDPNDIKNTEGYFKLSQQIVEVYRSHMLIECIESGRNINDMVKDMKKDVVNIQSHAQSLSTLCECMESFYTKNGLKDKKGKNKIIDKTIFFMGLCIDVNFKNDHEPKHEIIMAGIKHLICLKEMLPEQEKISEVVGKLFSGNKKYIDEKRIGLDFTILKKIDENVKVDYPDQEGWLLSDNLLLESNESYIRNLFIDKTLKDHQAVVEDIKHMEKLSEKYKFEKGNYRVFARYRKDKKNLFYRDETLIHLGDMKNDDSWKLRASYVMIKPGGSLPFLTLENKLINVNNIIDKKALEYAEKPSDDGSYYLFQADKTMRGLAEQGLKEFGEGGVIKIYNIYNVRMEHVTSGEIGSALEFIRKKKGEGFFDEGMLESKISKDYYGKEPVYFCFSEYMEPCEEERFIEPLHENQGYKLDDYEDTIRIFHNETKVP